MRSILQRVYRASVTVDGEAVGEIGPGLVVLCAAGVDDTEASAVKMADRVWGCRIFPDAEGKMNLALKDMVGGNESGEDGENGEIGENGREIESGGGGENGGGSECRSEQLSPLSQFSQLSQSSQLSESSPLTQSSQSSRSPLPSQPQTANRRPSTFPSVLAVSNFTVYGDTTQRRPSFVRAAPFEQGRVLFDRFVEELRRLGCHVETGVFGADMKVSLVNDGPVTVVVET